MLLSALILREEVVWGKAAFSTIFREEQVDVKKLVLNSLGNTGEQRG